MDGSDEVTLGPGVIFPAAAPDLARLWMTTVHEMARLLGSAVVGELERPCVDRSFYRVSLMHNDETNTLMLNPAARVVACVEGERPFPANAKYSPVRHPECFTRVGLAVAAPSAMERSWNEADLTDLTDEEAEQVRYHRPQRIGDLIFNWFD